MNGRAHVCACVRVMIWLAGGLRLAANKGRDREREGGREGERERERQIDRESESARARERERAREKRREGGVVGGREEEDLGSDAVGIESEFCEGGVDFESVA